MRYPHPHRSQLTLAVLAMGVVVLSSNILVQYAINDWLTWGAFTFPVAFLVTDLTNRAVGAGALLAVPRRGGGGTVAGASARAAGRRRSTGGWGLPCGRAPSAAPARRQCRDSRPPRRRTPPSTPLGLETSALAEATERTKPGKAARG